MVKINRKGKIHPFATFLYHQHQLYELLEKGNLNADSLKKLLTEEDAIDRAFKDDA